MKNKILYASGGGGDDGDGVNVKEQTVSIKETYEALCSFSQYSWCDILILVNSKLLTTEINNHNFYTHTERQTLITLPLRRSID